MIDDTQGATDTAVFDMETAEAVGGATPETDTATPATDQSPTPDTPPVQPDATSPEGTDAPADPASPTPPEIPAQVDPFSGGEPFAFRLDGRQVAPEGAKVINDHVVMPMQTWRNQMQNMLADRPAIKEREQQYRGIVSQAEQRAKLAEAKAAALVDEFDAMLSDPNKLMEKVQNWEVNGPLLREQVRANAAERELREFRERETAQRQEQERAQLIPQLETDLGKRAIEYLADQGIGLNDKGEYPPGVEEWFQELLEDHGVERLYRREQDGRIVLDDRAYGLFERGAKRFRSQSTAAKVTEQKAALNAAAVAPSKAKPPAPVKAAPSKAPPPAKPRNPDGTFQRQTADEWEREFMRTQYSKDL